MQTKTNLLCRHALLHLIFHSAIKNTLLVYTDRNGVSIADQSVAHVREELFGERGCSVYTCYEVLFGVTSD